MTSVRCDGTEPSASRLILICPHECAVIHSERRTQFLKVAEPVLVQTLQAASVRRCWGSPDDTLNFVTDAGTRRTDRQPDYK